MKFKESIIIILILVSSNINGNNHIINTVGTSFSPSFIQISIGDTVTFINTGGIHNVNGNQSTFPLNPESFGNSVGSGWTYTHVFTLSGFYTYQCDPHVSMGMTGQISVGVTDTTDCNNIVNGTSIIDSCGECQQAYLYDFINHIATYVDNANILIPGVDYNPSTQMVVMPGDPGDPNWNSSCFIDCNDVVNGTSMTDTCGICHQAYIYDFITHAVTFIDDTVGIIVASTEIIVLPDHPQNPYWNNCDSTTTNIETFEYTSNRKLLKIVTLMGKEINSVIF